MTRADHRELDRYNENARIRAESEPVTLLDEYREVSALVGPLQSGANRAWAAWDTARRKCWVISEAHKCGEPWPSAKLDRAQADRDSLETIADTATAKLIAASNRKRDIEKILATQSATP